MHNCDFKPILIMVFLLIFNINIFAGAEEKQISKEKKKYPHPHTLHLEAKSERTADFSIDEIKDWSGFVDLLQKKLQILPLSVESRMVIRGFKPFTLTSDEKAFIINEINKLLLNEKLGSQVKGVVTFSDETKKLESDYRKTGAKEDMKWLNRSIINDIFPQTAHIERVKELKQMTCATCHEAWGPKAWGVVEEKVAIKDVISESEVMECFSKAIVGEKTMEECIEMVNEIKKSRIEPYGPLKNFVLRSDTKGEIPFFVAVHPEDPYTFKPLLKKLVCLECHSRERKVDKIMGRDGKVKKIQIFYGAGSEKREHVPEEYYIRD